MICKFCNSELEEGSLVCPVCGCALSEEPVLVGDAIAEDLPEEQVLTEMPVMEMLLEAECDEQPEEPEQPDPAEKPKRKGWVLPVMIASSVLLVCALVVAVLYGFGFEFDFGNRENDVWYKESYTVKDSTAKKKANTVVAAMKDIELTNDELQVHYWMQVYDFQSYYGSGYFDISQPLDKQWYSKSGNLTWQQYFIEAAIAGWERNAVLYLLAEENDTATDYSAMHQTLKDHYIENLKNMASQYGYESADAMVKADMGAGASAEGYADYMVLYSIGASYYSNVYESIDPTMDQIEVYFADHEADYAKSGITKSSGKLVDVRHILLQPEGGEKGTDGNMVYTQEAWDACYAKAEALLTQWQNGEATEASFGELANANSTDPGSNTKGGLYTGVTKGYMVDEFDAWIFDESREAGNTGIVKTKFGYHIMYFVDSEEAWIVNAREDFIEDKIDEMIDAASERWPMDVNYKKIVLSEISS